MTKTIIHESTRYIGRDVPGPPTRRKVNLPVKLGGCAIFFISLLAPGSMVRPGGSAIYCVSFLTPSPLKYRKVTREGQFVETRT